MNTNTLRQQHEEILVVAHQLAATLDDLTVTQDARQARSLVSQLCGRLNVHLSFEDRHFYPSLLAAKDAELRARGAQFQAEMAPIAAILTQYKQRWPSALIIQGALPDFIQETREVLAALMERVTQEEQLLFPLADRSFGHVGGA